MMTTLGIALALGLLARTRALVHSHHRADVECRPRREGGSRTRPRGGRAGLQAVGDGNRLDRLPPGWGAVVRDASRAGGDLASDLPAFRAYEARDRRVDRRAGAARRMARGSSTCTTTAWRRSAAAEGIPLELALGITAAHEIGHLLIGPAHSNLGVMRATLGGRDWHDAAQGALLFDREQSSVLRTGACRQKAGRGRAGRRPIAVGWPAGARRLR